MMIWLSQFDLAFCQDLALTLTHFLWEGLVIAVVAAAIATVLRRQSSHSRYVVYLVAVLLMAACLPVTFAVVVSTSQDVDTNVANINNLHAMNHGDDLSTTIVSEMGQAASEDDSRQSATSAAVRPPDPRREKSVGSGRVHPSSLLWRTVSPYVVAVYLLGLAIMLLRVGSSLFGGHRLRCDAIAANKGDMFTSICRVAVRVGLRRVPLVAFCHRVSGPVVIGVMRPMVLLPITLTTGITPQQLEVVLVYEFVHVRRYDHVVLLFQRVIEAILFFHPAVWYITRCLSVERENCCDDAVMSSGAPRVAYAELLLQLAEQRMSGETASLSLAAVGDRPSQLRKRLARLFGPPPEPMVRLGRSGTILLLCLFGAMILPAVLSLVLANPADRNASGNPIEQKQVTTDKVSSNRADDDEPNWGEPLLGLRMRLTTAGSNEYRYGVRLPLVVQMQNVTEKPIRFEDLAPYCDFKVHKETGAWLGIASRDPSISPWERSTGSLGPRETLQWHVWFDRFWLNKPAAGGSTVQIRVGVPRQIVEPGKLPRTSYSEPIKLKLIDTPPSTLGTNNNLPQLASQDVSDRWTDKMDLVYREEAGLVREARAIHIDGQGNVTMFGYGTPGRTAAKLDADRLNRLAARLQQMKIWKLSDIRWQQMPPPTDASSALISLAYDHASIVGNYPRMFVRSNETLRAFQDEILTVIDEAVKAVAIDNGDAPKGQETPAVFDGGSGVLASYLNASDENHEQKAKAAEIVENARVVILRYEHDRPTQSVAEDIAFAKSLKGSWVEPLTSRSDGDPIPGISSAIRTRDYSAIRAVFSKYYGSAKNLTSAEWLAEMKRPIATGFKLKSITVFVIPSRDVMERSLAEAETAALSVARGLASIKGDFAQLDELARSHLVSGDWAKGGPRFPGVAYRHDVGVNRKQGPEKFSATWCQLNFGFSPFKGFPVASRRPSRDYPLQGIHASWSLESDNDELKRKFHEMVIESLKELDALEVELAAKEVVAAQTD